MRRFDRLAGLLAWCTALTCADACVVKLDREFDDAGAPAADAAAGTVSGCRPFPAVEGDVRSIPVGTDRALWLADDGSAFDVALPASADCEWTTTALGRIVDPSPLEPEGWVAPLDLVDTGGGLALYYELFAFDPTAPLGLSAVGFGVAPRDATSGRFVPTSHLLFSPDRPSFGASALRQGEQVYVWGCQSAGFLASDCFVARVPTASVASPAAYSYWAGDGWSSNPDDAVPAVRGAGSGVSVRQDGNGATRLLMTYVPPLGSTLVARSAGTPEGPWSAPVTLASCDLIGAGANQFCSGGQQHPELTPQDALFITYAPQSFAADAGALPHATAPHLVALPVPASLP
jgi:hypothetical protein